MGRGLEQATTQAGSDVCLLEVDRVYLARSLCRVLVARRTRRDEANDLIVADRHPEAGFVLVSQQRAESADAIGHGESFEICIRHLPFVCPAPSIDVNVRNLVGVREGRRPDRGGVDRQCFYDTETSRTIVVQGVRMVTR